MKCKINDAKTGDTKKEGRWVDCKLIEGTVGMVTNHNHNTNSVLLEYMRAYDINGKIVEKLNRERFYYSSQIKK